ncbi:MULTISPECIES: O105 family O-antigen polymerase [Enterobacteriaceae]|uniref:O105 family O-antigen polymerase n=1 Tax=Enterobacteriaceae TaxID=543 RepID=UPI000774F5FA|nr:MULTISPECIES: O105 family O-antigen polymerase [Enterobacteriaceae]EAA1150011.1 EpsG family protein [Shigella boydii]EFH7785880.1 hypothetical protein [Escherichia coli]EFQ1265275.1 hypothetical protein [Shigella boydii]EFV8392088.1 hypothetical protein [Shigella boydii]EFW7112174.1 EpsG family protein [Shigella boydii]
MVYGSLWCLCFILSFFNNNSYFKYYITLCIIMVLWFLASFRGAGVDGDYANYIEYINDAQSIGYSYRGGYFFDWIVNFFVYIGLPVTYVFAVYALAIPIKIKLFQKFSLLSSSILLGYVGFFIYLHDFTQIRAGLAVGIAFWGIYYYSYQNKIKAVILFFASCFIHPSLIFLVAFVYINKFLSNKLLVLTLMISIMLCVTNANTFIVQKIVDLSGSADLDLYYRLAVDGQIIKPFGAFPLLNLFISIISLYYLNNIARENALLSIFIKMLLFSQISWFLFSPIPVLAARISQIFLFSIVFVLPHLSLKLFNQPITIPALYSFVGFLAFIIIAELMHPYQLGF